MNETKRAFKPEFLNRVDELIVFHKLSQQDLHQITDILLTKVMERMKKQGIALDVTKQARELIVKNGTDDKYGARPLRRMIQNMVEDPVAEKILEGSFNEKIVVDSEDEKIIVKSSCN